MPELQTFGGVDGRHRHPLVVAHAQRLQHRLTAGLPVVQRGTLPAGIPPDPVPQSLTPQRGAHHLLLRVQARQHRALPRLGAALHQPCNRRGHAAGLVRIGGVDGAADPDTALAPRRQPQVVVTVRRSRQHLIGAPHDLRRGTVVDGQIDVGGQRRELVGEAEQIIAARAGERIDGLRGIPHHAHVAVAAQPQSHQPVLQRRDVLIFVHGQPADRGTDSLGRLGHLVEQVAGNQQDVVEIDLPARGLLRLVGAVDVHETLRFQSRRRAAAQRRAHPWIVVRGNQRDLAPVDLGMDVAQVGLLRLRLDDPRERPRHQGALIVADMRERPLAHVVPHPAQLVQGRGMERRRRHRFAHPQFAQPGAHLGRRLDRERDGERTRRIPGARRTGVGDAARHRTGFAGTGHGHDAHRAVHRGGSGPLHVIQPLQDLIARSSHATHCAMLRFAPSVY